MIDTLNRRSALLFRILLTLFPKLEGVPMPRKIFFLLLHTALLFCICFSLTAQYQTDFFPFSVWYSGGTARAPMLSEITPESRGAWRKDLEQIKSLGFNTVRTWVEWAKCEPKPGEYNFENLKLLFELAQEVGLKVFIQYYVDSAPDWVAQSFPHGLFETQSGVKVIPQAAPGACTDNDDVREAVLKFYSETAKIASQYPNFYGYDLWSEPHIINWASIDYVPNVQFCFCPGTRARFREWLKEKYPTLDDLNRAWYRNFDDWNNVDPPRFSTILSYTDFIDWKMFIYDKLVGDLKMRYDAVKSADPNHVVTSHAVGASLFQSPYVGAGATDDFLMSKPVDFYGVSIYPKHNHPDRHWSLTTLRVVMDFTRSANRKKDGWYVGELQAGKGTIGLLISDPVTPRDHRIWVWSAIAKGAKAINIYAYYPMSSGYESGGYGLINLDGSVTERAEHAGSIARIVNENQKLFIESLPAKAEIAIVYNPLSQMVGGLQRRDYPAAHTNSLIGYYRAFADHNIPADFIHRDDLERHDLDQYKLVIIPWPVMFTQKAADGVAAYVRNGGYVLAEARLAWNDDRGYAADDIPGLGLSEVFGVREGDIWMKEEVLLRITDASHPAAQGLTEGENLKGNLYAMSVEPLEGRPVSVIAELENGLPAVVASRYGNGETMLVGSFLGMAGHPEPVEANDRFYLGLLDWAGIIRPFTSSHDGKTANPVEIRLQENPNGYVLYVINHSSDTENVSVSLRVNENGLFNLTELTSAQSKEITAQNNSLKLTSSVVSGHVQVWSITHMRR
jgi:beta-galactosidase